VKGLVCFVIAALAASTNARAQEASAPAAVSSRPLRGAFRGVPDQKTPQSLDFTFTLDEGYDDNMFGGIGQPLNVGGDQEGGFFTDASTALGYVRRGRHVQFAADLASGFRYFRELGEVKPVNQSGNLSAAFTLPKRSSIVVREGASYTPTYLGGLFPGSSGVAPGEAPLAAPPDYVVQDFSSYSSVTSADFTYGATRKSTISLGGDYRDTRFARTIAGQRDITTAAMHAKFARSVSRNTDMTIAYRFTRGDFGYGAGTSTEHGIDWGLRNTRRLSATRRVSFDFSVGSSAVDMPAPLVASGGESGNTDRLYRVTGTAAFTYQFVRTWQAQADVRRGFEFIPELAVPVYTNGATAVVDGMLTDRLAFNSSAGYSDGKSALTRSSSYTTYQGTARLKWMLTRAWAMYGEYQYYYYDLRGTLHLLPGVPPSLNRNSVRIGMTLWVPVVGR